MKEYSTIVQSVTTEKSAQQQIKGQYAFIVSRDATKVGIKQAIKAIYGADVATVRTSLLPAKTRLVGKGRIIKKRLVTKKALVTLKTGQTIDPNKIKDQTPSKTKRPKN